MIIETNISVHFRDKTGSNTKLLGSTFFLVAIKYRNVQVVTRKSLIFPETRNKPVSSSAKYQQNKISLE